MRRNRVGNTEVQIPALSFGCSNMAGLGAALSEEDALAVAQRAWDLGLRYFDTAPHYGRDNSEERLGKFLKNRPWSSYVLFTKVGRVLTPGAKQETCDGFVDPLPNDVHCDYSAYGFRESIDASCARLGIDVLDIVYVHDIGSYTHAEPKNSFHLKDFRESGYAELLILKQQGRNGAIGLGVNETDICLDLMRDCPSDAILLAGRLTLLDRSAEPTLTEACIASGTSLILGGIFNSGILATGPRPDVWFDYAPASKEVQDRVRAMSEICSGYSLKLPQVALRFAMDRPNLASVLIGTSKSSKFECNVKAAVCKDHDGDITSAIAACAAHTIGDQN